MQKFKRQGTGHFSSYNNRLSTGPSELQLRDVYSVLDMDKKIKHLVPSILHKELWLRPIFLFLKQQKRTLKIIYATGGGKLACFKPFGFLNKFLFNFTFAFFPRSFLLSSKFICIPNFGFFSRHIRIGRKENANKSEKHWE